MLVKVAELEATNEQKRPIHLASLYRVPCGLPLSPDTDLGGSVKYEVHSLMADGKVMHRIPFECKEDEQNVLFLAMSHWMIQGLFKEGYAIQLVRLDGKAP